VENGTRILEGRHDGQNEWHVEQNIGRPQYYRRLVFARLQPGNGYVYLGTFDFDIESSRQHGISIYNRVATRAPKY
jgi:hypothetical protein